MAIISCPECGKSISNDAVACPNYGYRIKPSGIGVGTIILFVLFLILGCLSFLPSIYVSENYYKVPGYMVSADYGDSAELEGFRRIEELSEYCEIAGIIFCSAAVLMLGIMIYKKCKKR